MRCECYSCTINTGTGFCSEPDYATIDKNGKCDSCNATQLTLKKEDRALLEELAKKFDKVLNRIDSFEARAETPDPEEYIILPDDPIPDEGELPFPEEEKTESEPEKPTVTLEAIRKKAVELSASGKKDEVRKIVKGYAEKVSEIPEDKWDEVWKKLVKLEG